MPDSDQHLALRVGVLDLLHFDDLFFVQNLDCVKSRVVLGSNEVHPTERPCAKTVCISLGVRNDSRSLDIEISQRVTSRRLPQRLSRRCSSSWCRDLGARR